MRSSHKTQAINSKLKAREKAPVRQAGSFEILPPTQPGGDAVGSQPQKRGPSVEDSFSPNVLKKDKNSAPES